MATRAPLGRTIISYKLHPLLKLLGSLPAYDSLAYEERKLIHKKIRKPSQYNKICRRLKKIQLIKAFN